MPTAFSAGYDFEKTGYNIWVTFAAMDGDTDFPKDVPLFACKSVKDAGFEAGDKIDITTNATVGAKEYAPADLSDPQDMTLTAAYNLDDRALALALLNRPCNVSVEYRACNNRKKGRKVTYKGAFLSAYDPGDMSMGEFPEVSITIGFPGGTHIGTAENYNPAGELTDITAGA
jgi:hypothetical protein